MTTIANPKEDTPQGPMTVLARQFAGDRPVISCYLDGNQAVSQWRQFVATSIADLQRLGRSLPASSVDLLYSLLESNRSGIDTIPRHGLAIFILADSRQPVHKVVRLDDYVRNHFDLYSKPNLLPLIHASDPCDSSMLLTLEGGTVRVYSCEGGHFQSVGWAKASHIVDDRLAGPGPANDQVSVTRRLKRVCQALLKYRYRPLILAARRSELAALRNWLPRNLFWTIKHEVVLPMHGRLQGGTRFIRRALLEQLRADAVDLANRVVHSLKVKGNVAAGPLPTIQALNRNRLDRLVVDVRSRLLRRHCQDCGEANGLSAHRCTRCGSHHLEYWDPYVEATYAAVKKGIPVVPVESESLRYVGGMGGLLLDSTTPVALRSLDAHAKGLSGLAA